MPGLLPCTILHSKPMQAKHSRQQCKQLQHCLDMHLCSEWKAALHDMASTSATRSQVWDVCFQCLVTGMGCLFPTPSKASSGASCHSGSSSTFSDLIAPIAHLSGQRHELTVRTVQMLFNSAARLNISQAMPHNQIWSNSRSPQAGVYCSVAAASDQGNVCAYH